MKEPFPLYAPHPRMDENFYKHLLDSLYDGVYFVDRERRITYWNKAAERLSGYAAEEVIGKRCADNILVHVDDAGRQLCLCGCPLSATMGDRLPREADVHMKHKLGHRVSVLVRAVPICDSQGEVIGAVEVFSDNTAKREAVRQAEQLQVELAQRRRAEEALSRSEGHLRAIVDHLPIGVWFADADGKIVFANPAAEEIFGQMREVGGEEAGAYHAWWAASGKRINPDEWGAYRAVMRGETSLGEVLKIESCDGTLRTLLSSAFPVKDAHGRILGAVVIHEDITERERAQESLMRAEKLASAGRVAATIAHEINNPIMAVINVVYMLRGRGLDADSAGLLAVAEEELRRVANITRTTLGFYRTPSARTVVNIRQLLEEVIGLYARKLQESSIEVQSRYPEEPRVVGNEGELRQVFSNLLGNAVDACPGGGRILVRVRRAGQRGLHVTVADTGAGIERPDLPNIFEPFFTTKQTVGTGLGLWVSKTIVQKHSGSIRVRSKLGRGTVFRVFLPASESSKADLGVAAGA